MGKRGLMRVWRSLFVRLAITIGFAYAAACAVAQGRPVTIFAAASLKEALDAAILDYRKNGGAVSVAYAGSNTLARQIEQGAPADIFISADTDWMDYLAARKLLREESVVPLLQNSLVLIAPRTEATPLDLADRGALAQRLKGGRLAVADTNNVPAGRYARASLEKLGLWTNVSNALAQADNVRAALLFVARGESPLGVVYATDAKSEPRVSIVARFPENTHPPVVYPAALMKNSQNPRAAEVLGYLKSPQAQAIFETQGFVTPGKPGT